MNKARELSFAGALVVSLAWATPAMAVTSTRVVITQEQQEVPETRIQLFDASTGTEVQREDDDDSGALFLLDGGRYRVVVDGETVREISVTGRGSETFEISLPPAGTALSDPPFDPGGYAGEPGPDGPFVRGDPEDARTWDRAIGLFFGGGRADVPQTGIGFRREGAYGEAPDSFAAKTPNRVNVAEVYGSGFFHIPGTDTVIRIWGGYREGDGGADFEIPRESGIDSGVVYGGLSPSGSSGIATPFGLSGEITVDYSSWNLGGSYRVAGSEMAGFAVDGYLQYRRFESDYSGTASYTGAVGENQYTFSQTREQSLNEDHVELGLRGTVWFMPMRPLTPYVSLAGGIYHRSTHFASLERNVSNFGPTEDREFTLVFDESDNGIAAHGSAEAGLEIDLSPAFGITAGASVDYRSEVGAVSNPSSGDQVFYDDLTTELGKTDAWSWRAFLGGRFRF